MNLTFCGLSALRVLRQLRGKRVDVTKLPRIDLRAPSMGGEGRWARSAISAALEDYGCVANFNDQRPLDIAVPSASDRLRVKGVTNTVHSTGLPSGAFLELGDGLSIASPELLFVELANKMAQEVHLIVGMELCGTYARDATNPRNGAVTYQVPAATSVERIRSFIAQCRHVNGLGPASETLEWLLDNAWSPMEAVVAALAVLPEAMLGYAMWPVDLNPRTDVGENAASYSRVPDLVFRGTSVGLNYDGDGHLPLKSLVDAAMHVVDTPGEQAAQDALVDAVQSVREGVLSDKRRDRDLSAAGFTVLPLTKEDLYERGGLDRLMLQVMDAIERSGKRDLSKQRTMMSSKLLGDLRQLLIWSLLPGRVGTDSARLFAEFNAPNPDVVRYVKKASFVDGTWLVSLAERDM